MLSGLEIGQVGLLAALGAYAGYMDVRFRKLPNMLCLVALALGLGASFALGGTDGLLSALLHAVIALVLGMLLFAAGVIGGGDAKFYTGIAAWFALRDGLFLFVSVALSGLVLLLVWIITRRLVHKKGLKPEGDGVFDKLPYGVAISLGGVVAALMLGLRS
ncbi:prepilin peptidase [Aurantiacibacter sp. MUD11]|uniref:A24 family peptidase n=1 Tax=Aurantiacibacter sp. MUD11 TaxID=3003265 RepID=UPI0022AAFCB1|nr:prepilin peptidase [Aurantiacibacter sp. MUD11]WAT16703.1 prepilin peptidase [Aurantiacibacter sp. MUD11]